MKIIGVIVAVLIVLGIYHEASVFSSKGNPPGECQLLGGTWNMFTGWNCDGSGTGTSSTGTTGDTGNTGDAPAAPAPASAPASEPPPSAAPSPAAPQYTASCTLVPIGSQFGPTWEGQEIPQVTLTNTGASEIYIAGVDPIEVNFTDSSGDVVGSDDFAVNQSSVPAGQTAVMPADSPTGNTPPSGATGCQLDQAETDQDLTTSNPY